MPTQPSNGQPRVDPQDQTRGAIGTFASDMLTLGELQIEMFQTEAGQDLRRLWVPIGLLVTALILALATFPVLLIAIAWLLHAKLAWPLAESLLATGLSALGVAGLVLVLTRHRLSRLTPFLAQSRQEWKKNRRWMKTHLSTKSASLPLADTRSS